MDFFDQRILVTGGSGFLGSHLVGLLRRKGAKEILVPTSSQFDLRERKACAEVVKNVDLVFHLAGNVGGIGYNQGKPGELFYDNITMGVNMMHEAMIARVKKFVGVATVCSYPKYTPTPFREEDLWNGYPEETNAPYGLAKKMLVVMSDAYRRQYGFNSIVVVPTNLYGPGDEFNPARSHVIPALIRKAYDAKLSGAKHLKVWGDGSPTRDFLYVEDAAEGLVIAAERYDKSDPVNLGSGEDISIRELARTICELAGYEGELLWDKAKPNGQPRRRLDTTKARREFGFEGRTPLREGLAKTISWYVSKVGSMARGEE